MRILVTGATGFVGQSLTRKLVMAGHELVVLSRSPEKVAKALGVPCESYAWQAMEGLPPAEALKNIDGVINMMGESLADGRWTDDRKRRIYNSRVLGTKHLVEAIDRFCDKPLAFFISFSAIGYYPTDQEAIWNESSKAGSGFLADVCQAWEAEAAKIQKALRTLILRVGTVLGYNGGAVQKLLPVFKWGIGGPIGQGQQWMSWIHIDDLVSLIALAVNREDCQGTLNAVAPEPVTNKVFSQVMARTLKRPMLFVVPEVAMKLAMGEMSQIVLDSQKVVSIRLSDLGFRYRYPTIDHALAEACGVAAVGLHGEKFVCERLETCQFLERPIEEVFEFFSDPYNLEKITPPLLSFEVVGEVEKPIRAGSLIDYRLKLHGVPMKWQTLIKEWETNHLFVDFQLKGPYQIWHHQHIFYPLQNGTLMIDRVDYRLPMGYLGNRLALSFVKKDVETIFRYRYDNIEQQMSEYLAGQGQQGKSSSTQSSAKSALSS